MNYRLAKQEDQVEIDRLCLKNKLNPPSGHGIIFIAEDEEGIVGLIKVSSEAFIEPLVSENPLASEKLFIMAQGFLHAQKISTIRCLCNQDKVELYKKVGFDTLTEDKILMEKVL